MRYDNFIGNCWSIIVSGSEFCIVLLLKRGSKSRIRYMKD